MTEFDTSPVALESLAKALDYVELLGLVQEYADAESFLDEALKLVGEPNRAWLETTALTMAGPPYRLAVIGPTPFHTDGGNVLVRWPDGQAWTLLSVTPEAVWRQLHEGSTADNRRRQLEGLGKESA